MSAAVATGGLTINDILANSIVELGPSELLSVYGGGSFVGTVADFATVGGGYGAIAGGIVGAFAGGWAGAAAGAGLGAAVGAGLGAAFGTGYAIAEAVMGY